MLVVETSRGLFMATQWLVAFSCTATLSTWVLISSRGVGKVACSRSSRIQHSRTQLSWTLSLQSSRLNVARQSQIQTPITTRGTRFQQTVLSTWILLRSTTWD